MERLSAYLESNFRDERVQVIISNNGSTDDTSAVAKRFLAEMGARGIETAYLEYDWKDYSESVRKAVLLANGEHIVWLGVDIDDLGCIGRGLRVAKETGADVVLLSKYRGADWRPAKRVFINRAYNILVRAFDGLWYSDAEGYMLISSRVRPLFDSLGFSRRNTLNLNLLYYCKRLGFHIEEAPFFVAEKRKSVFLMALPQIVLHDLKAVLTVHHRFKEFSELRSHQNRSFRQP
jgi:glycosyltransferase involved in cell wall biosynthesis